MEICPFTGQPCFETKCFRVMEIQQNKCTSESKLCMKCGLSYTEAAFQPTKVFELKTPTPDAPATIQSGPIIPKEPVEVDSVEQLMKLFQGKDVNIEVVSDRKCGSCDKSLAELKKDRLFGCPKCYESFYNTFQEIITPVARDEIHHTGKRPKKFVQRLPATEQIKVLKLQMAAAIEQERFDDAAAIKSRLNDLINDQP